MSPRAAEIIALVRELPDDARREVLDTLLDDSENGQIGAEWQEELDRRSAELDAGNAGVMPLDAFLTELRAPASKRA